VRSIAFLRPDFGIDPWPTYAECRRDRHVWFAEDIGMVCIFGYEEVRHVLTNPDYTVEYPFRVSEHVFGKTLLDMDGDDHRRLRGLLAPVFSRANVASLVTYAVGEATTQLLSDLRRESRFDFVRRIAVPLPALVTGRFLGIPPERMPEIAERLDYLLRHLDGSSGDFERARADRLALEREMDLVLASARPEAPYLRVPDVAASAGARDGRGLLMLMLAAGVETSVCALANMMSALLRHPQWIGASRDARVRASVVREVLRWEPPQHDTVRFARVHARLGDVDIRAGQALKVILASANRDERAFHEPDSFRPGRAEAPLMSFGHGNHTCLGRALVAAEMEHVLGELVESTEAIEADGDCELRPVGGTFRRPAALPLLVRWRTREAG
jgi:cytochrome P450